MCQVVGQMWNWKEPDPRYRERLSYLASPEWDCDHAGPWHCLKIVYFSCHAPTILPKKFNLFFKKLDLKCFLKRHIQLYYDIILTYAL